MGTARYATHLWVLGLALGIGALLPVGLRHPLRDVAANATVDRPLVKASVADTLLKPPAYPLRGTQLRPLTSYAVQPGDTIPSIAERAGLSVETLIQVNHLSSGDELVTGEVLMLPPVDGKMVAAGSDTSLALLGQTYKVDPNLLRNVNNLPTAGALPSEIFVPSGQIEAPSGRIALRPPSETRRHLVRFVWPTQATLTQGFWPYHPGVDLANAIGTPVVAADAGRIVFAGMGSYGIYVEIDHGNGFTTVYGHLSRADVGAGQLVRSGQLIGLMGMTGRATGPHLHFEVRFRGVPQNPIDYLP